MVVRDAVGLGPGAVTVELHQLVGDEVHGAGEARQHLAHPRDVLVARAGERAVVVGGIGVVAGAHELEIEPIDAPAVPEHDGADRLLVEERLHLGVMRHGCTLPRARAQAGTATGTLVGPCTLPECRNSTASSSTS